MHIQNSETITNTNKEDHILYESKTDQIDLQCKSVQHLNEIIKHIRWQNNEQNLWGSNQVGWTKFAFIHVRHGPEDNQKVELIQILQNSLTTVKEVRKKEKKKNKKHFSNLQVIIELLQYMFQLLMDLEAARALP